MKYILIENYTQATLTAKCHQHLTLVRIPYCGDICPYPIMVSVVIVNKTELGRFHLRHNIMIQLQQELFEGQLFRFEAFFGYQTLVRFPDPPYGVGRENEPPRSWEFYFGAR